MLRKPERLLSLKSYLFFGHDVAQVVACYNKITWDKKKDIAVQISNITFGVIK